MGAEIPRYNLEKLPEVSPSRPFSQARGNGIPLILDDLPEAVDHAVVSLIANGLASLDLSACV
jgi:hypothetical protein